MSKGDTLDSILSDWNSGQIFTVASRGLKNESLPKIPFSSATLNYMCYGGMPRGFAHEFSGAEGSGKTTAALDLVGNAQMLFAAEWADALAAAKEEYDEIKSKKNVKNRIKELEYLIEVELKKPKSIAFFDLERTLNEEWAVKNGVDVDDDNFLYITPADDSAEVIMTKQLDMMDTGEVGLMITDSLTNLVPKSKDGNDLETKTYGGVASVLADFSPKASRSMANNDCTYIMINQLRDNVGVMYGPTTKTPGGRAIRHLYSTQMEFRKGKSISERGAELTNAAELTWGNVVDVSLRKAKMFKPDRKKGTYTIKYDSGMFNELDLLKMAIQFDIVQKSGAWYTILDPETGELLVDDSGDTFKVQGEAKMLDMLMDDGDLYNDVMEKTHLMLSDEY